LPFPSGPADNEVGLIRHIVGETGIERGLFPRFPKARNSTAADKGIQCPRSVQKLKTLPGDVHAVAEGTPIFANEPILEVIAPIGDVGAGMILTLKSLITAS